MRTVEKRCEITMPMRPLQDLLQLREDRGLRFGIERRGRLVENPDVGVAIHDAREREPLPLAARQIVAALEQPADFRVEAVRHLLHQPVAARVLAAPPARARRRPTPPGRPICDVLADRQLVARVVLEQHADAAAQRLGIELAQIDAADPHRRRGRIVEAQQQLDERALAGAVLADQRDQLAAANVQVQVRRPPARSRPDT